jgi:hypothetical protein
LRPAFIALLAGFFLATAAHGEDTPLRILVRADDAKFIGSAVGGLFVMVRNADSGELLGSGRIDGGTGDTAALMKEPQRRGRSVVTDDAASLTLTLDLDRPTRIAVDVTGPQALAQGRQQLTTSLWLLPGQDRASRPLVLHLNGLLVDVAALESGPDTLAVTAEVSMLCGCTISEEGPWRAEDFLVRAVLYSEGQPVAEAPLAFTGETSRFAATLPRPGRRALTLELQALQHSTGNTGVYRHELAR